MIIKVAIAIAFVIVFAYFALWSSETTKESVELTGKYIKTGIRATKHSREMIKDSKVDMKEREKMADFEDQ